MPVRRVPPDPPATARTVVLARSAAGWLEAVAIFGIAVVTVAAAGAVATGIAVLLTASGSSGLRAGAITAVAGLVAWPLMSLPCYAGLVFARHVRLRADSAS